MKKYFVILLLIVCATGFSQTPASPSLPPYVEVTGAAEMAVGPDVYYIHLRIMEKVFNSISSQEKKVGAELAKVGIPSPDFVLTANSADWIKQNADPNARMQYRGYVLYIHTDKALTDVFNALDKAGVEQAFVAGADFTKKDEIINRLSVQALKNANGKATAIMANTGGTLGKPLAIVEEFSGIETTENHSPAPYNTQQNNNNERPVFMKNYESIPFKVSYRITYSII